MSIPVHLILVVVQIFLVTVAVAVGDFWVIVLTAGCLGFNVALLLDAWVND